MLYLFILGPILTACVLLFLPQKIVRWLALAVYIALFAVSVYVFNITRFTGRTITATTGGEGILGITLFCDLTASIFLMMICFLFLCFFFYSAVRDKDLKRLDIFITLLQSLIILVVLSRDLFNIFIAIEVATALCAILIMYKKQSRSVYDGIVYFLVNNTGMMFFLFGIGILYRQYGVLDITALTLMIENTQFSHNILPFALIMTGACLKCALFPVFMWLPHAHGTPGAPTIVSAILSGVYVKGGIYLFIRMRDMFMPAINMDMLFIILSVITAFSGILMAIKTKDIKLILAYSTISQIGLIMLGICLDNEYCMYGAMLHIINHSLFKSLLFLAAGVIIHNYGTRNICKIRGVLKTYPVIGLAVIAGILGITGAPLFNGIVSKYYINSGIDVIWIDILFNIINFGTVLIFIKFGHMLVGKKEETLASNDKSSDAVLAILGILCLLTGIFGSAFLNLLFGVELGIDLLGYVVKTSIWLISFAGAWLLYKKFISNRQSFSGVNISFNIMSAATVLLFAAFVFVGYLL